jgi:hypothetical protein
MKRKALWLLIIVAIPLYLWDSYALFSGIFNSKKPASKHASTLLASDDMTLSLATVHFETKGRSPFLAYKEKPNPIDSLLVRTKKQSAPKPAAPTAPLPKIAISGIMWHPTNPIAMVTLPDGSSSTVKTGQTIGAFKFKTIEKNRVLVIVDGNEFWIAK